MADGVWTIELRFEKSDVGDGRGFGHAVSLAYQDVGQIGEAAREIGSERRGAGLYPRNLMVTGKLAGFGGLAESIHGGWDKRHGGDAFVDQKSDERRAR